MLPPPLTTVSPCNSSVCSYTRLPPPLLRAASRLSYGGVHQVGVRCFTTSSPSSALLYNINAEQRCPFAVAPSACRGPPAVIMLLSRPSSPHCGTGHRSPSHSTGSAAAVFKAELHPSLCSKLCSLKNGGKVYNGQSQAQSHTNASPVTNAPINADFLQLMRVKMVTAFIKCDTAAKVPEHPPLPPPPSLDRVLLRRAILHSRTLRLLSGQAPAAAPHSCNPWHDPILVPLPPLPVARVA